MSDTMKACYFKVQRANYYFLILFAVYMHVHEEGDIFV